MLSASEISRAALLSPSEASAQIGVRRAGLGQRRRSGDEVRGHVDGTAGTFLEAKIRDDVGNLLGSGIRPDRQETVGLELGIGHPDFVDEASHREPESPANRPRDTIR